MSFTVTIELPEDIEQKLQAESPDMQRDVKEAYALQLFREGHLSHFELSRVLGLDRFETDAYLKRHNVYEGSITMEDLVEETRTLDRVMREHGRS
jgi:predicted HTH domain antitoxin